MILRRCEEIYETFASDIYAARASSHFKYLQSSIIIQFATIRSAAGRPGV
jgi:hypothetical protein